MKTCPHCAQAEAVPIAYGYPSPEGMEAAERGEVVLGGCVVTGEDPRTICRACGSRWSASRDKTQTKISEELACYFANWDINLPAGSEAAGSRGAIFKAGWNIHYLFGQEDGERYIEFYAVHRMTNDRRHRIYESGRIEELETIQQLFIYDPKVEGSKEESERHCHEHNRRVAEELQDVGLYPEGDINTFLRTNQRGSVTSLSWVKWKIHEEWEASLPDRFNAARSAEEVSSDGTIHDYENSYSMHHKTVEATPAEVKELMERYKKAEQGLIVWDQETNSLVELDRPADAGGT